MRVIYDVTPQVLPGTEEPTVPEEMLTPGLEEEELGIYWERHQENSHFIFEMSGRRQYLELFGIV